MTDCIQLYHIEFDKEKLTFTETILNKLKEAKSQHRNFNDISNKIINEGFEYREKLIVKREPYLKLFKTFTDRASLYEENFQFLVIQNDLKPEFEKINTNKNLIFEEFITSLATYQASSIIYNLFRNNNIIYKFMYRLNKFNGYDNMANFEIVRYDRVIEGTVIYIEMRKQLYPNEFVDNNTNVKNYFQLNEKYHKSFLSLDFYSHLTDEYIASEKTSFEDFNNVFWKHPSDHNSLVVFFCSTRLLSQLINSLKSNFFKNLKFKTIEESDKFRTSILNKLTADNISQSKRKCNAKEILLVENSSIYLKHLTQKMMQDSK
jgi:hypothetical protein